MDFPPRPQMPDEARPLFDRHSLPDVLRGWPQPVDDGAPIAALSGNLLDLLAQQPGQSCGCRRQRPFDQRDRGRGAFRSVSSRQKPTARQGVDRSGVAGVQQRDRGIDHRQSGADQQHRGMRIEARERLGRPRIRPITRGVIEAGIGDWRRLWRKSPDRQHRDIGFELALPIEIENDAAARGP
jgi:hypothetical protein